ncbi:MAG TPA: hypothetical protein VFG87_16950 [Amycolatopsis sp.]|nr:hypothetical protein [Amycolatopsis sp.]
MLIHRDGGGGPVPAVPGFARELLPAGHTASITLRWPDRLTVAEKREVLQVMIRATAGRWASETVSAGKDGELGRTAGAVAFRSALEDLTWWLGELVLVFRSEAAPEMLWFSGADGAFLHIRASEPALCFHLVSTMEEVCHLLGWTVAVR